MSRNPYDRRTDGRPPAALRYDFDVKTSRSMIFPGGGFSQPRSIRSVLTLADLDVMADSVAQRTRSEVELQTERRHQDDLQEARRLAWDEGQDSYIAERDDRDKHVRRELLEQIDSEFGDRVRKAIRDSDRPLAEGGRVEAGAGVGVGGGDAAVAGSAGPASRRLRFGGVMGTFDLAEDWPEKAPAHHEVALRFLTDPWFAAATRQVVASLLDDGTLRDDPHVVAAAKAAAARALFITTREA